MKKKVLTGLVLPAMAAVSAIFAQQATLGTAKLTFTAIGPGTIAYEVKAAGGQINGINGAVVIPATYQGKPVTAIANNAFAGKIYITGVTIPNSVTFIGAGAFNKCEGITGITIPAGVTEIGGNAFANCTYLTGVTFQKKVAKVSNLAFLGDLAARHQAGGEGTYMRNPGQNNWTKGAAAQMTPYKLTFTEINKGEAYEVKAEANAQINGVVDIPAANKDKPVIQVAAGAFSGKVNITGVTIPNGVTSIGAGAFDKCAGITRLVIPASVTRIGEKAFTDCTYLAGVTLPKTVSGMNDKAFPGDLVLKYRDGGEGTYTRNPGQDNWAKQGSALGKLMFAETGKGYEVKKGNDQIDGEVVIPAAFAGKPVIRIADAAFSGVKITGVTIPAGVTAIGKNAFTNTSLRSVTIPVSVTQIGDKAFDGCSNLTEVTFSSNGKDTGQRININVSAFPGNLADLYKPKEINAGPGTYKRMAGGKVWEKQK